MSAAIGCIRLVMCHGCEIGQHPPQRSVHDWADAADVSHALATGQRDPRGKPCNCWCSRPPQRIQRRRTKGYRLPPDAVYVGRPTPFGNPFPIDGDWITWAAVATGHMGDRAGRRDAAVAFHRAWLTRTPIVLDPAGEGGGSIEFSDGTVVSLRALLQAQALTFAGLCPQPILPERPDLTPLRGHDLACWCGLDDACHADTLLALANA